MKKEIGSVGKLPLDLIIRRFKGEATVEEDSALEAWLKGNDARGDAYSALRSLWDALMLEGMDYKSAADELWKRQDEICGKAENREIRFSRAKFRWAVAAAGVLLAIGSFLAGHLVKEMRGASASTLLYAAVSGKSKALLPDGSSVWLNSGTTLEYKNKAWKRERSVFLDGEAYFDVAHDGSRPFVVESGGVSIAVHGTKFNVNAYTGGEDVKVSLIDGSVSVSSPQARCRLEPGDEAVCNKGDGRIEVGKSDVGFAAVWANDSIRFERKPIREVARYLSKWYGVDIMVDESVPDNQAYAFLVKGEPLEEILRLMARINPIKYAFDEDYETVNIYNNY